MYKIIATTLLVVVMACITLIPHADASTGDVAAIGNDTFPSLKDALSASVDGDVVFLLQDHTLPSDVTVPKGVVLVIPYSDERDADGTMDGRDMESTTAKIHHNDKVHITLTIPSGTTMKIDGTLVVGGVMSRPFTFDYQGHTSGEHSVVRNNGSITVNDGGVLRCHGYIKGTGIVDCKDGSRIYEPFVVTDYVGGDCVYVQYDDGQSPFDRYAVINIQSQFRMEHGSSLMGMMNLYADSQYNKAEVTLVGEDDGFIVLSPGSTYTSTYEPRAYLEEDWESNIYRDIGRKDIVISGGAETGSIVIHFRGESADTADTVFSIPYNYSYTLRNGEYVVNDGFRLLPGAQMTISSDAVLRVKGELQVFPGLYSTEFRDKHYPRPETLAASSWYPDTAMLNIDGTMVVEGKFRGTVSGTPGAMIHVRGDADVSEGRLEHGATGSFNGSSIRNLSRFQSSGFLFSSDGTMFDMVPGETCQIVDSQQHGIGTIEYLSVSESVRGTMDITSHVTGSWVSSAFGLSYDLNGGNGDVPKDGTPYAHGSDATVAGSSDIYRIRHVFKEWNTSPDGTGTAYREGDAVRMTEDVTLHAIWTFTGGEGNYIVYDGNADYDGHVPRDTTGHEGDVTVLGSGDMEFTGHEFREWNTSPDGTGTAYREGDVIPLDSDVFLYAVWEVGTYAITFDSAGGSSVEPMTQEYGTPVTKPGDPTREGYTFMGWSPELPTTMPWKGTTVKAQWKINEYLVTFDSAGGTPVDSILVTYGKAIPIPESPVRYGYGFLGWEPGIPATMPAGSLVLTAQWKALPFHDVTVEVTGEGIADPDRVRHPLGYTFTINLIPDNGFRIDSVKLDGTDIPASAVQTITVSSDHVLSVEFVPAPGTSTVVNDDGTVSTIIESTVDGCRTVLTKVESQNGTDLLESVVTSGDLKVVSSVTNNGATTVATVVLPGQRMESTVMDSLEDMASIAESQTGRNAPLDLTVMSTGPATIPKVDVNSLTVECNGISLKLPKDTLGNVFSEGNATFDISIASKDDMNNSQKDAAGPMTVVSMEINDGTVSELGGTAYVSVDYTSEGRVTSVDRLNGDGSIEPRTFKVGDGKVVFQTDSLSLYRITDDGVHEESGFPWTYLIIGLAAIAIVVGTVVYMRLRT